MYPGSIGLCGDEGGKQMLKSKKSEKGLVNGSKWATGDIFIGKVERNPDRFRRLVDFFSPISSFAPHSSSTPLSPKDQQLID